MIKKINYVWLGGNPLPPNVTDCINSWKKYLPDWEIIQWNESNFDVNKYRWVREALSVKKWTFAGDFVRMYILLQEGGIYMDTDVKLYASPKKYLTDKFVSGILDHHHGTEYMSNVDENGYLLDTHEQCQGFGMQVGFMYAEPNHPFIKHFLDKYYDFGQRHFINENGTYNQLIPDGAMFRLLADNYGAKYIDATQKLVIAGGVTLYDSSIFSTRKTRSKTTVAIHWYDQTWQENTLAHRIKKIIKKYLYFIIR